MQWISSLLEFTHCKQWIKLSYMGMVYGTEPALMSLTDTVKEKTVCRYSNTKAVL